MYLYFQPKGGFNDILCGIHKILAHSKTHERTLLIDTRNTHYHINFSDYFDLPYTNVIYDMDTISEIFKTTSPTIYPKILSGKLQDIISGRIEFVFTESGYCYKDHVFKLPTEPQPETVLIHSNCGGGNGYLVFKDLQFTQKVKDLCAKRYKLLQHPYLCLQIRHTDYTCNYEDLYLKNKDTFRAHKSIYVATDNPTVLEFFAKNDVQVQNFTTFSPSPNARNLHKSAVDPHTKLTDMLTDLYLCVMADKFLSNSTGGYINLIRKCRSNKKHTAQQFQ